MTGLSPEDMADMFLKQAYKAYLEAVQRVKEDDILDHEIEFNIDNWGNMMKGRKRIAEIEFRLDIAQTKLAELQKIKGLGG